MHLTFPQLRYQTKAVYKQQPVKFGQLFGCKPPYFVKYLGADLLALVDSESISFVTNKRIRFKLHLSTVLNHEKDLKITDLHLIGANSLFVVRDDCSISNLVIQWAKAKPELVSFTKLEEAPRCVAVVNSQIWWGASSVNLL